MVEGLVSAGALVSPRWQDAFRSVPRHLLVPHHFVHHEGAWQERETTEETAYSNTALFVLPDVLSSSSMPSVMARMLEALDPSATDDVLEIGTGAGYNAALLGHVLGDERVTSIDVERVLVDRAAERLDRIGRRPRLVVGDGALGVPSRAPFRRLVATCSVPSVPRAWIEQTVPGALLLLDLKIGSSAGNLVALRRGPDGASGPFLRRWGGFMSLRSPAASVAPPPAVVRDRRTGVVGATALDLPRPWEDLLFWFFLHLDGVPITAHGQARDPRTGRPGDAFLVGPDGSWCEVAATPRADGRRATVQGGPRRLWDEVQRCREDFDALGEVRWDEFALHVSAAEQVVSLERAGRRWWHGPHGWTGRA